MTHPAFIYVECFIGSHASRVLSQSFKKFVTDRESQLKEYFCLLSWLLPGYVEEPRSAELDLIFSSGDQITL